jgi:hypothetical protein
MFSRVAFLLIQQAKQYEASVPMVQQLRSGKVRALQIGSRLQEGESMQFQPTTD